MGCYEKKDPTNKRGGYNYRMCLEEKLYILKHGEIKFLNKRSELVSKCKHTNKFLNCH